MGGRRERKVGFLGRMLKKLSNSNDEAERKSSSPHKPKAQQSTVAKGAKSQDVVIAKPTTNTVEVKSSSHPSKVVDGPVASLSSSEVSSQTGKSDPTVVEEVRTATKLDCTTEVHVKDIDFALVDTVIKFWDNKVKQYDGWLDLGGEIFLRKLFEIAPETIEMFGFPANIHYDDPGLAKDQKFMLKGKRLFKAIDIAVSFLGPDLSTLEDTLFTLGGRHVARKCKPKHWPVVGVALFYVFEVMFKSDFTFQEREAWTKLYNFMGYHMIRGLLHERPSLADETTPPQMLPSHSVTDASSVEMTKLDCTKEVRAQDIDYKLVDVVMKFWEVKVKQYEGWLDYGGEIFLRKLFQIAPETISMFGFDANTHYDDPSLRQDKKFMLKGKRLFKAIDIAVSFLGPDLSTLEDTLFSLGGRHVARQCRPYHWPIVGEALFYVFEVMFDNDFTRQEREAWTKLYNFMGYHMIRGLIHECPSLADESTPKEMLPPTSIDVVAVVQPTPIDCTKEIHAKDIDFALVDTVMKFWDNKVKQYDGWLDIGGEIFLRKLFEIAPETIEMFGFPANIHYDDPGLAKDQKFMLKGKRLFKAIDIAVSFLGPDLSTLEDTLFTLGGRHVARKCKPRHWPVVGVALFYVFEVMFKSDFTFQEREAWTKLYNFMGYHMIRGLLHECPSLADETTPSQMLPSNPVSDTASSMEVTKLDCSTEVHAVDIDFALVNTVMKFWENKVKQYDGWLDYGGEIFLRKLFQIAPETIDMFGFPQNTHFDDPCLRDDKRFMLKGKRLFKAIDIAVSFLGPDLSTLEDTLFSLGGRHVARKCKPYHWPIVGEALFYVFEVMFKSDFTFQEREAWTVLYNFMGYHMIRGLLHECPSLAEDAKPEPSLQIDCTRQVLAKDIDFVQITRVVNFWENKVKGHLEWLDIGGDLFLRRLFETCPETRIMFGFSPEIDPHDPKLSFNVKFMRKGKRLFKAIDIAVSFLGPDLANMEATLFDMGTRHVKRNCRPEHWPVVGEALFYVFDAMVGKGFTAADRQSWTLVYNFMGYHMIRGLEHEKQAAQE